MKYFAYGSNMSLDRIQKRCPSAVKIGVASISKYKFACHKASADISSKADAVWTGSSSDKIYGVVYEISGKDDIAYLDVCEGVPIHYKRKKCNVVINGNRVKVWVYLAQPDFVGCELRPLFYYMNHIIVGAEENNLPKEYVDMLKSIKVQPKRKLVEGKAVKPSLERVKSLQCYWQ